MYFFEKGCLVTVRDDLCPWTPKEIKQDAQQDPILLDFSHRLHFLYCGTVLEF
jgi:hypothetical protein